MPIIRIKKRENPYVQIDRAAIEDNRLSWRARGILAYLLGKPDEWSIHLFDIVNHGLEGRDAVQAAMKELQEYGYATLQTVRGDGGKMGGKEWVISEQPTTGFSVRRSSPTTGKTDVGKNRSSENPHHSNNNNSSNNKHKARSTEKQTEQLPVDQPRAADGVYTFAEFWNDYAHKVGSKSKAEKAWNKLNVADREAIRGTLEAYKRATVTSDAGRKHGEFKPMRQHPQTYLNGRVWETYTDAGECEEKPEGYDRYLEWVKAQFPKVAKSSTYLSPREYVTHLSGQYVKGMVEIGEVSIRNLLKRAHEEVETGASPLTVFQHNVELLQNRVKSRQV